MDLFAGVLPFLYTAEELSLRRAAQRLGVTPSSVSKALAKLEQELGVKLLDRTPRRVTVTSEGAAFLEHCREAVARLKVAREQLLLTQQVPRGTIKVAIPPILGRTLLSGLARLSAEHPQLSVRVQVSDQFVDLATEDIDVGVRIGGRADPNLVLHPLRTPWWTTVASPGYLAKHGTPRSVAELSHHNCLAFIRLNGQPREWAFRDGSASGTVTFRPRGTLAMDDGQLLLEAAAAGVGVVQVMDFMASQPLANGALVEVLRPVRALGPAIRASYLPRQRRSPKVRAFLQILESLLGDSLSHRAA